MKALQAGPARQLPNLRATLASGGRFAVSRIPAAKVYPSEAASDVAPSDWAGLVCCSAKLRPVHSLGITQIFFFSFPRNFKNP